MVEVKSYITRVLAIVKRIYPKEYPQIEAMYKAYEAQIPKKVTIAQINRALKVVEVITVNLETMKDDLEDEEDELEEMGIGETE